MMTLSLVGSTLGRCSDDHAGYDWDHCDDDDGGDDVDCNDFNTNDRSLNLPFTCKSLTNI